MTETEQTLIFVIENETGRIDKYLSDQLEDYSRSQVQSWITDQLVTVNDETVKSNYKIQKNDQILVNIPKAVELEAIPEDIPIEIVYQDADVAVVNKPQGMVVHPAAGHATGTLVNALLFHIKDLSGINGKIRPGIVHRIDKDTSGLLMVAKNDKAHAFLSDELKDKKPLREYVALVHGEIPHEKGTIDAPIGRDSKNRKKFSVVDDGKPSVTHFEVIKRFENFTLIKLRLETGRTHQIRVHMEYIDFPLAGDPLYGPKKTLKGKGQFLHARSLGFVHPTTKEELHFEAELPDIFVEQLDELNELTQK